ncbi:hypothetical protein AgCh_000398 [Apium graveolens]
MELLRFAKITPLAAIKLFFADLVAWHLERSRILKVKFGCLLYLWFSWYWVAQILAVRKGTSSGRRGRGRGRGGASGRSDEGNMGRGGAMVRGDAMYIVNGGRVDDEEDIAIIVENFQRSAS